MQPRHLALHCSSADALLNALVLAVVRQTGAVEYPFKRPASRSLAAASSRSKVAGTGPTQAQLAAWASSNLPQQYKKVSKC
eukprot:1145431-Pelagomonas_calceolata.AAC.11